MQARQTLLILAISLFLSGCDFSSPRPSMEALEAQARAEGYGQRIAELDYLERQAALYNGCRFMVNICPSSITEIGRKAVESNEIGGGGTSSLFWIISLLKFLLIGAAAGVAWAIGRVFWTKWGEPSAGQIERAREKVRSAEQEAAEILAKAQQEAEAATRDVHETRDRLDGEVSQLEGRQTTLQRQIQTLEFEATQARRQADALRQEVEELKRARDAASSFD